MDKKNTLISYLAQNEVVIVSANTTEPVVNLANNGIDTSFNIGIKQINEVDESGNVVYSINFGSQNFMKYPYASNLTYVYTSTLENSASISITVSLRVGEIGR